MRTLVHRALLLSKTDGNQGQSGIGSLVPQQEDRPSPAMLKQSFPFCCCFHVPEIPRFLNLGLKFKPADRNEREEHDAFFPAEVSLKK